MCTLPSSAAIRKPRVAIIGAGISGLSVGLCLCKLYKDKLDVTIMADRFSPRTTSDRAGGLILPYFVGSAQADDRIELWAGMTFDRLNGLYQTYPSSDTGVYLVPCYTSCWKAGQSVPSFYRELMLEFRILSKSEAAQLRLQSSGFEEVWTYKTMIVESHKYLPWLTTNFRQNGGLLERRRVKSFDELSMYDLVVNCTGLGARELANDCSVYPVRGQIVSVQADNIKEFYEILEEPCTVVIPHRDEVLLGGTEDEGNWSTISDPDQAKRIHKDCLELVPDLQGCPVAGSWACLRPVRKTVRLEIEKRVILGSKKNQLVVHNYGHGGQRYVLHWGCAVEAAVLIGVLIPGLITSKL